MLIAKRGSGELAIARDEEKNAGPWTCPVCNTPVYLHKGSERTHHFAHAPSSECAHGAGESEAHVSLKLAVYDTLRGAPGVTDCRMERRLGAHNIPDVSACIDGTMCAFEVQLSGISIETLERRTASYQEMGVPVLWLTEVGPAPWQRWILERHKTYYSGAHLLQDGVFLPTKQPEDKNLYRDPLLLPAPKASTRTHVELEHMRVELTKALRRPGGEQELTHAEAEMLHDFYYQEEAPAPYLGRTMSTLCTNTRGILLAMSVLQIEPRRPLLLTKARHVGVIKDIYRSLSEHWQLHTGFQIQSYEFMSGYGAPDFLNKVCIPDLIILDGIRPILNKTKASARLRRYMRPDTKMLAVIYPECLRKASETPAVHSKTA